MKTFYVFYLSYGFIEVAGLLSKHSKWFYLDEKMYVSNLFMLSFLSIQKYFKILSIFN